MVCSIALSSDLCSGSLPTDDKHHQPYRNDGHNSTHTREEVHMKVPLKLISYYEAHLKLYVIAAHFQFGEGLIMFSFHFSLDSTL